MSAPTSAGYIRPEIADSAVPIDSVTPYPGNARRGNIAKIKQSLVEHGQYKEILVQATTGYVLVGNNTLAAMRELGYTEVAVKRLDVDDNRARGLLLFDNASSDDSDYDRAALAELLAGVSDWDASGWEPDDLDDLLAQMQADGETGAAALAAMPDAPRVLPQVPSTDAAYAEPPGDEQARQERLAEQIPRYTKGLAELILVMPEDDKAEANQLMGAVRQWLGPDLKAGEVVLRALRTLVAVGDSRHNPDDTLQIRTLLMAAGYDQEDDTL